MAASPECNEMNQVDDIQSPATQRQCCHCDTINEDILCYCTNCQLYICQSRTKVHKMFPDKENHDVINHEAVPQSSKTGIYCSKHREHLKRSCIPCGLLICLQCKIEEHDTHETEDIQAAFSRVLPELTKAMKLLTNQHEHLREYVTGYKGALQEVTNRAREIQESVAELMKSNEEMLHLETELQSDIDKLAITYQVQNKKVLDKIKDLLNESKEAADKVVSQEHALKSICSTPKSTGDKSMTSTLDTVGKVLLLENEKVQPTDTRPTAFARIKLFTSQSFSAFCIVIVAYLSLYIGSVIFDSQHNINEAELTSSFRHTKVSLPKLEPVHEEEVIKFQHYCRSLAYYNNTLWCASPDNLINVYNICDLSMSVITFKEMIRPLSLHPLTSDQMLLAAKNGFYLVNSSDGSLQEQLQEGFFYDVHVSDELNTVLEHRKTHTKVHIFNKDKKPALLNSFPVQNDAHSLLIHDQHIYVSSWFENSHIKKYTLKGELVARFGKNGDGAPGQMINSRLCAVDTEGNLLIADTWNHQFQVLSPTLDQFTVVKGMDLKNPLDTFIVGEDMFVLHTASFSDGRLVKYEV